MIEVPQDILWQTFSGSQRHFTEGNILARRYARGISPILAFAGGPEPDFDAIEPYVEPGESFYVDLWTGPVPQAWELEVETELLKMIWAGGTQPEIDTTDLVPLSPRHAQVALDLALLTNPGPFGLRTLELGDYFGVFDRGNLIAMAGERMFCPPLREISGVCTHPDAQGRGLAKKLMIHLVQRALGRGEVPFLHVRGTNEVACGLYRRMGFRDSISTTMRVIRKL